MPLIYSILIAYLTISMYICICIYLYKCVDRR